MGVSDGADNDTDGLNDKAGAEKLVKGVNGMDRLTEGMENLV